MKSAPLQGRFSQNGAGMTSRAVARNEQYSIENTKPPWRGALCYSRRNKRGSGRAAPRDF